MTTTSATHLRVGYPNGEGYTSGDFSARLAFTVGAMKNDSPSSAIGGTLSMVNERRPARGRL